MGRKVFYESLCVVVNGIPKIGILVKYGRELRWIFTARDPFYES